MLRTSRFNDFTSFFLKQIQREGYLHHALIFISFFLKQIQREGYVHYALIIYTSFFLKQIQREGYVRYALKSLLALESPYCVPYHGRLTLFNG